MLLFNLSNITVQYIVNNTPMMHMTLPYILLESSNALEGGDLTDKRRQIVAGTGNYTSVISTEVICLGIIYFSS